MQKSSAFRISDLISEEKSNIFKAESVVNGNHLHHHHHHLQVASTPGLNINADSSVMPESDIGGEHNWETCPCLSCQTLRLINLFNPIYMNCHQVVKKSSSSPNEQVASNRNVIQSANSEEILTTNERNGSLLGSAF
jgi:hypothetical protein